MMKEVNFTPSTVFLTTFIMALNEDNFRIQLLHGFLQATLSCENETVKIRDQISVRFIQAIAAFTLAADGRM
jgi:hypothetical protein